MGGRDEVKEFLNPSAIVTKATNAPKIRVPVTTRIVPAKVLVFFCFGSLIYFAKLRPTVSSAYPAAAPPPLMARMKSAPAIISKLSGVSVTIA